MPAAAALSSAIQQTEQNRRDIAEMFRKGNELIPAKITGTAGSGSGLTSGAGDDVIYLAWTEQTYDSTSGRYDKPNGLSGTASYMPARTPNGDSITSFPFQAFVRRTVVTAEKGPEYEVIAGGTGGSGGGDRVEIVEPYDSGVSPPDPLLIDGRVVYFSTTPTATAGEAAWLIDANTLPELP